MSELSEEKSPNPLQKLWANLKSLLPDRPAGNWSWVITKIAILIALAATYLAIHIQLPKGEEFRYLSKDELRGLHRIVTGERQPANRLKDQNPTGATDAKAPTAITPDAKTATTAVAAKLTKADSIKEAAKAASTKPPSPVTELNSSTETFTITAVQEAKAVHFLQQVLCIEKCDTVAQCPTCPPAEQNDTTKACASCKQQVESNIRTYGLLTYDALAEDIPYRIPSWLYLTEPFVYIEVLFWSLFGIFCNMLYGGTEAMKAGRFLQRERFSQWATIVYAPFCVLVIYLSLDILQENGAVAVRQYTRASIILSFLLGFFSGRVVLLIYKLKDLLIPLGQDEGTKNTLPDLLTFTLTGKLALPQRPTTEVVALDRAIVRLIARDFSLRDSDETIKNTDWPVRAATTVAPDGAFKFSSIVPEGRYLLEASLFTQDHTYRGTTQIILTEGNLTLDGLTIVLEG